MYRIAACLLMGLIAFNAQSAHSGEQPELANPRKHPWAKYDVGTWLKVRTTLNIDGLPLSTTEIWEMTEVGFKSYTLTVYEQQGVRKVEKTKYTFPIFVPETAVLPMIRVDEKSFARAIGTKELEVLGEKQACKVYGLVLNTTEDKGKKIYQVQQWFVNESGLIVCEQQALKTSSSSDEKENLLLTEQGMDFERPHAEGSSPKTVKVDKYASADGKHLRLRSNKVPGGLLYETLEREADGSKSLTREVLDWQIFERVAVE